MEHLNNEDIFKIFKEEEPPRFSSLLYITLFAVNIAVFSMGTSIAWSSPATSKLKLKNFEENQLQLIISPKQEAGIVSLLFFGAVFGILFSKCLMMTFGRKGALLTSGIPNMVGFFCLTAAHNLLILYIGRFLNGFAIGIILAVSPLYVHEISDISNRKLLNGSIVVSTNFGCLFVYILSLIFNLKQLSMINVIFPLAFMVIFGIMSPETPYYYVSRGRIRDAWDSLRVLRSGNKESIDSELFLIQREVVENFSNLNSVFDFIKIETFRNKLWIALGLIFCNQFIGISTILCYIHTVFDEIKPKLSSSICVIIVGIIQVLGSIFGTFIIPKNRRRLFLLLSVFHLSFIHVALATFLSSKQYQKDAIFYKIFPIICICYLVWISTISFTPCVIIITKEIFPSYANSVAVSVEAIFMLISTIIITACFPFIRSFGIGCPFIVFSIFSTLTILFVYFLVPEQNTE